jgi:hypothetical protein
MRWFVLLEKKGMNELESDYRHRSLPKPRTIHAFPFSFILAECSSKSLDAE